MGFLNSIKINLVFCALFFLVQGCAALNTGSTGTGRPEPIKITVHDKQPQSEKGSEKIFVKSFNDHQEKKSGPARLVPYTAEKSYKISEKREKQLFSDKQKVSITANEMVLSDFITYLFSDIFQSDFVIDPSISRARLDKTVTLSLQKEVTEKKLYSIVTKFLAEHEIDVVSDDNIFYLKKSTGEKKVAFGVGVLPGDVPDVPGQITQLVPVKYADVQNLYTFLPRSSGVGLQIANNENMIILRGKKQQIIPMLDIVRTLDRPAMRGRFLGKWSLAHADSKNIIEKLKKTLKEEGIPVAASTGRRGVFFISLENKSLLIYFAAEKQWITRIEYWLNVFDIPKKTDKKEYYVYFPENSRASELLDSLGAMLTDDAPVREQSRSKLDTKKTGGNSSSETVRTITSEKVKLSVDENRNALLIYAAPEKYQEIKKLVQKLDIMPVQVLLEASVFEVTLTENLQYGLEWYLRGTGGSSTQTLKTLDGLDLGAGGFDLSIITNAQDFKMAINAMMKNDRVKILSSPRVMVRDGKSASITVGTEVPVVTSESQAADAVTEGTSDTVRSVQYRSTGISLNVTPMVHSTDVVTMEISQEVSEAQANTTSSISSPMILNRSITTEVVASDGQTVLLGGLIKENKSRTEVKIPLLGDIPLLGHLFKTNSTGGDRTELVIMITPHIIRNSRQIKEVRDAVFKGLESIELLHPGTLRGVRLSLLSLS